VVARAKEYTLGKANILAQVDKSKVINPTILADPAMVADAQEPRILHAHPWFDYCARSDFRSEQTKQPAAKHGGGKHLASQ
jgi:hypothetical protein